MPASHRPSVRAVRAAALLWLVPTVTARADVFLSEVFYDAPKSDAGLEWVELANDGDAAVDLSGWSLGWGGSTYTTGLLPLSGVISPGQFFVIGGPSSTPDDASPVFDLAVDLEPDLQNSGAVADGIALFDVPADEVAPDTVPISALIYGDANTSGLIDETGAVGAVNAPDAPAGSSLERGLDGVWRVQPTPTPGRGPQPVPEPSGPALGASAGLGLLLAARARRRATEPPTSRAQLARSKKTRCALS
jgi:hypothetical protein